MQKDRQSFPYKADYLEDILEQFHDGIYITDAEANTIYLNHSYERISGLTVTDMLGRNMKTLVNQGVISLSGTLTVLQTGEEITTEQSFKTGKRAVITSTPIFKDEDPSNGILMVVTIVREMTEIYSVRKEMRIQEQLKLQYQTELEQLKNQLSGERKLIAEDANMKQLIRLVDHIRLTDAPAFLSGKSGTGKSTIAAYIHQYSKRSGFPFLRINLSVLPREDAFGYLFGKRDALGDYQLGLIERAVGGTIYLENLDCMPMSVQENFLSLLRDGQCVMGDGEIRKPDIRFLAGSEYTLEELRTRGQVGGDILYVLSMFSIKLPPLSERTADILSLADCFLQSCNREQNTSLILTKEAGQKLLTYSWPGNVRELEQMIRRAAIICKKGRIGAEDLEFPKEPDLPQQTDIEKNLPEHMDLRAEVAALESHYMTLAFDQYKNVRDAAAFLGMDASTFTRKRQKYEQMGLMSH